ncbi:uncharacterized protein RCH25_049154 [Pelodytes ibericus]
MEGPFPSSPIPGLLVSPLGVVPKKEQGKFRLIHHLSFPRGRSVNDGIDDELCKVSYTSFDQATRWVRKMGQGALLAKTDIEAAFRLLPVHPSSFYLLGCQWEGGIYVDKCLPMGCAISCSLFETFSSFLEWVIREESGSASIIHYLDDFLCVGPPDSSLCLTLLRTVEHVMHRFGVPLSQEKTVGPTTTITFLGIEIDSVSMECRLPLDKVVDLRDIVSELKTARKVQLRQLQSLLGKLNFACKIIPMGRIFCRRLSLATAGIRAPHHYIRLTQEHRADLMVWDSFLRTFNGRSLIIDRAITNKDLNLWTDASGSVGFGAIFEKKWCWASWPRKWFQSGWVKNLAFLELFPIVVSVILWGPCFENKKVRFWCDNLGVVQAINNGSASSPPVIRLLKELVLICLQRNLLVQAVHVPGIKNDVADSLSRQQWERFRLLAPGVDGEATPVPQWIWGIADGRRIF